MSEQLITDYNYIIRQLGDFEEPILDIGTGMGGIAQAISSRRWHVISIDMDLNVLTEVGEQARDLNIYDNLDLVVANAENIPFPNESFETVICFNLLHHLLDYEPPLYELYRVLTNGGKLLLADFNEEGFRIVEEILREEGRIHTVGPCCMDKAIEILEGKGLKLEREENSHNEHIAVFVK